jgi:hypothetical protein
MTDQVTDHGLLGAFVERRDERAFAELVRLRAPNFARVETEPVRPHYDRKTPL